MNLFALSSLLVSIAIMFLGNFVLYRNPKSALNRVFFLLCLSASFLSFAEFGLRQAESLEMARFWLRASMLLPLPIVLELHFVLLFTEASVNKALYALFYGSALIVSFLGLADLLMVEPVQVDWGWTYSLMENESLNALISVWFTGIAFLSIFLCARFYRRTTSPTKKRQALYVLLGLTVLTSVGLFAEVLSPYLPTRLPETTGLAFVLECLFITYAIWRHRLFALTPATAADNIVSTMTDALFLANPQGQIVSVNQAALKLSGYDEEQLVGQPLHTLFAPAEGEDSTQGGLPPLYTEDVVSDAERTFLAQDGSRVPLSLSASALRDQDGIVQGAVYVGRNLTERKRAEEQIRASLQEKEVMLKEIHHRVKNNMQVITSLLYLQSRSIQDPRAIAAFQDSQGRVRSMALVHEMLYQSRDLSKIEYAAYLKILANHMLRAHAEKADRISLNIDCDDVYLDVNVAIPCGLLVNELLSNSFEHAFPDGRSGQVRLDFHANADDEFVLVVADNGVGLPSDLDLEDVDTLGLTLVRTLVNQLEGTLEVEREGKTEFRITFPVTGL